MQNDCPNLCKQVDHHWEKASTIGMHEKWLEKGRHKYCVTMTIMDARQIGLIWYLVASSNGPIPRISMYLKVYCVKIVYVIL